MGLANRRGKRLPEAQIPTLLQLLAASLGEERLQRHDQLAGPWHG